MNYWLIKSEPSVYSWETFEKEKKAVWDGVRNYAARLNLKAMKKGDLAFFYHSNEGKEIVGVAKITKEFYPDPKDNEWVVVEVAPEHKLKNPVTLAQVKSTKKLAEMALIKLSRLSVQPVKKEEFDLVMAMSEE